MDKYLKKSMELCMLGLLWIGLPEARCQKMTLVRRINYTNDANGARITRKVVYLPVFQQESAHQPKKSSAVVQDDWGKRIVKVYPNPVQEYLKIDVVYGDTTGEKTNTPMICRVYDSSGILLSDIESGEHSIVVDFSSYPKGWYIVSLQTGDDRKEYKIIRN